MLTHHIDDNARERILQKLVVRMQEDVFGVILPGYVCNLFKSFSIDADKWIPDLVMGLSNRRYETGSWQCFSASSHLRSMDPIFQLGLGTRTKGNSQCF